jgi:hypothetical protein
LDVAGERNIQTAVQAKVMYMVNAYTEMVMEVKTICEHLASTTKRKSANSTKYGLCFDKIK